MMTQHGLTTPFGRRTMSLAMAASQIAARGAPPDRAVHKWQMFRHICEARELLGPSDRTLVVLNALLTFLPETVMTADAALVVFPSNAQLSTRAHGMAPATLRRHLAALVELGLVIRRDSPNGKRFARKSSDGAIQTAYGFDLAPLVARSDEFAVMAAEVMAVRRERQILRERITLARRNCAKLLGAGAELCKGDNWDNFHARYADLATGLARSCGPELLATRIEALDALQQDIATALETGLARDVCDDEPHDQPHGLSQDGSSAQMGPEVCVNTPTPDKAPEIQQKFKKPGGIESHTERHIHNSDKEIKRTEKQKIDAKRLFDCFPLSLNTVLEACPDIQDYAINNIQSWHDLISATEVARAALGVSPDVWRQFRQDAGEAQAAAVLAAVLQRRDHISRPGGYLRALNDRLKAGRFSPKPMLMALARSRLRAAHQGATGLAATG